MSRRRSAAAAAPRSTIRPLAALGCVLFIFAAQAIFSLRQESSTWDETHYFGLGKYLLTTGRWDVPGAILHPPLGYYLAGVPLLFVFTDMQPWQYTETQRTAPDFLAITDTDRGQALLADPANAGNRLLTWSRLMMVWVGLLLCVFVYFWAARLYGPWAGVCAAALCGFSPDILAHARLITPDIAITTFSFITVYLIWRLRQDGRARFAVGAGIALGLALLSKYTALLLLPIAAVLWLLPSRRSRSIDWRSGAVILGLGGIVLAAGYGFHPAPYLEGLAFQQRHAAEGHWSFLNGEYSMDGWWSYFATAFVLKTPVALMLLLAIAGWGLARDRESDNRFGRLCLLLPAIVVFLFFSWDHQSIGLRYVLPMYPFLFVLAGGAAARLARSGGGRIAAAGLGAWYLGASLWIAPHYLAYFNELGGGPSHGYEHLVDSNLDWGQDLIGLKRYMDARGIRRISLSFFGSDDPARYGIDYDWLPSVVLRNRSAAPPALAPGAWVAISATNLQGAYFDDHSVFARFKALTPDAVIGYSLFVYHLK